MISPDLKSVKIVPAEQIGDAKASGWDSAFKMQGPKGELKWVPISQVTSARESNFAITSDNTGAARMITKQGQIAYALPNEVDAWEKNQTAVRVNPDGSLFVPPGQSEFSDEYRNRHDTYFQAHQSQATRNALATSDNLQDSAATTMQVGAAAGGAALAGPPIVTGAVAAAKTPAGKFIIKKALGGTAVYTGAKLAQKSGLIDKILEWF